MNLNFTISELVYSQKAIQNNINNMPDLNSLDNMLNLIIHCLQPIRDKLKRPMIITSGYRCGRLNNLVGGKSTSQHLIGQAADFQVVGMSVQDVINFIRINNFDFDQLIAEYNKNKSWIHISYDKNKNRKQILKIS